jgi:hypothetical protein
MVKKNGFLFSTGYVRSSNVFSDSRKILSFSRTLRYRRNILRFSGIVIGMIGYNFGRAHPLPANASKPQAVSFRQCILTFRDTRNKTPVFFPWQLYC